MLKSTISIAVFALGFLLMLAGSLVAEPQAPTDAQRKQLYDACMMIGQAKTVRLEYALRGCTAEPFLVWITVSSTWSGKYRDPDLPFIDRSELAESNYYEGPDRLFRVENGIAVEAEFPPGYGIWEGGNYSYSTDKEARLIPIKRKFAIDEKYEPPPRDQEPSILIFSALTSETTSYPLEFIHAAGMRYSVGYAVFAPEGDRALLELHGRNESNRGGRTRWFHLDLATGELSELPEWKMKKSCYEHYSFISAEAGRMYWFGPENLLFEWDFTPTEPRVVANYCPLAPFAVGDINRKYRETYSVVWADPAAQALVLKGELREQPGFQVLRVSFEGKLLSHHPAGRAATSFAGPDGRQLVLDRKYLNADEPEVYCPDTLHSFFDLELNECPDVDLGASAPLDRIPVFLEDGRSIHHIDDPRGFMRFVLHDPATDSWELLLPDD